MNSDELIKLLDGYMGNDGGYIKPIIENGESNFVYDNAACTLNEKREDAEVFNSTPKVACAMCGDIPNILETEEYTKEE